jgi:DNA-3-methyladenine glycosylase
MNKTQRFKRAAKPKRPISTSEAEDDVVDHETQPTHRSKTLSIRVKPKPKPKSNSFPIPDLSFDRMTILSPEFCMIDALDLAPRLLGKHLRRDDVVLRITEVTNLDFRLFPEKTLEILSVIPFWLSS